MIAIISFEKEIEKIRHWGIKVKVSQKEDANEEQYPLPLLAAFSF
jgi:hypothetical protein